MNFQVGDIVQVSPRFQPDIQGEYKRWHIVILDKKAPWWGKVKYDILCVELGRTWVDKVGENGISTNFVKIGEMDEEELKLARLIYL